MAKITNVDYNKMPSDAKNIRENGQLLYHTFAEIYNNVSSMHESWYGQRYSELVKQFNNLRPSLKSILQLVIGDIPFALETVANNYAIADTGSPVGGAEKTDPREIEELPVPSDTTERFISEEVETYKTTISEQFRDAMDRMDVIEQNYNGIVWESEAADAFKTKFSSLKSEIKGSLLNLMSQFNNLMGKALSDFNTTEGSNTVE